MERPEREYGPGESWRQADRYVHTQHLSNSAGTPRLDCLRLSLVSLGGSDYTARSVGSYPDGTLQVLSVTDEDGLEILTFTDRLGRDVLTRQVSREGNEEHYLDTYCIYDGMDNLVAVIPPALSEQFVGSRNLSLSEIERYAYIYLYDSRDRICAKKLPGIGWARMVYDDADRLVFSQDGVQSERGESTFCLYDIHGRLCVRGICSRNISLRELVSGVTKAEYVGQDGPLAGYSCSGVSLVSPQVMEAYYFDVYDFVSDFPTGLPGSASMYGAPIPSTMGRQTGSCMHEMGENVSNDKVWNLVRYDDRGRVTHTEASYPDGGWSTEDVEYDFLGNPVHQHRSHRKGTSYPSTVEDLSCTYDHRSRLLEVTHSLDGGSPVLLASNVYDELGRLSGTERGGSASLSSSYSYNVRSWLREIGGPLFSETLHYDDQRAGVLPATPVRYGGGVSSMEWRASGDSGMRSYDYSYDGLGRLVSADYGEGGVRRIGYGTSYSYDVMGNVLSLCREGDLSLSRKGIVDNLTMTYDGSRLLSVSDSALVPSVEGSGDFRDGAQMAVEYTYDGNGNMTSDLNRGISSVTYNRGNQPAVMIYQGGTESFTYLPDGTKLRREVSRTGVSPSTTEYRGNLVYEDGVLKYVLFDGGLVSVGGDHTPDYVFFLKDHLGSTRVAARSDGSVAQVNHYYPYGMSYASSAMASRAELHPIGGSLGGSVGGDLEIGELVEIPLSQSAQPYRFSGNELYADNGLGLYDFRARVYDPALGRFTSVDPLAEKYPRISPYSYCAGNPINFVDPDGRKYGIRVRFRRITISAIVYVNDNVSLESAKQAALFWNSRSNDTYKGKSIRYDITVIQSEDFGYLKAKGENTYEVDTKRVEGHNPQASGFTHEKTNVYVRSDYATSRPDGEESTTGAHELGHLLGMSTHSETGIMTETSFCMTPSVSRRARAVPV